MDVEESICEIVEMGLTERGVKVRTALTSEAALSTLGKEECDIVLCDFNLPGMSGEKMFEKLLERKQPSMPRFIFMTGELLDESAIRHFAKKGAAVLQKPFQISALVALVAEVLESQPLAAG